MKPFILTLTGPSLAGKSTLEKMLVDRGFSRIISTTTRYPRAGEKNGESYYFSSMFDFVQRGAAGEFIESVIFNDNAYGISAAEIERVAALGHPIVVVVEPNGRDQIRDYCREHEWHMTSVFVTNSREVIFGRLLLRVIDEVYADNTHLMLPQILDTYVKRLCVMTTIERGWLKTARECEYDVVLSTFDETNGEREADNLHLMMARAIAQYERELSYSNDPLWPFPNFANSSR